VLIRDPVHGDILLDPIEAQVLDLPEVQRLRGIRQLGTAHLVYPGAVHTRFDHSLGTCALARRLVRELRDRGLPIDNGLATHIGVGALLHDVTHIPFGHTLEDERRLFPRHDKGQRLREMLAGPLGHGLSALGLRGAVAEILGGEAGTLPVWARQIVSSTIDADLLDYLRRDSYFAGLAQRYDDRIFHSFTIADGQLALSLTKHGMERPDAHSEIVQLLRMRYFLTERVYYHHTKVAAGAMVSKAVEIAQRLGALKEEDLLHLGDTQLLERLRRIPSAEHPDPRLSRLIERLTCRALLKRGYVISALSVPPHARRALVASYHESPLHRHDAEQSIARELGCDESEVIVYCPALTVMKEAAVLVDTPSCLLPLNRADHSGEIRALEARYEMLWRFYVFVPQEHVARTACIATTLFGYPSEHQLQAASLPSTAR
jgi:HD superfamily phosphohydrolase